MKYVRVYESDCYPEEYVTTYLNLCEHVANLQNAGFDFEGCIVKQADTIEELVDEYVCVMPSGETFLLDKNTDLKAQVNYVGDAYGSIWIDGDLHKVAKMNKEGELCLI